MFQPVRLLICSTALFSICAAPAQGQSAGDIVKKSKALMKSAKTVQMEMQIENDLGKRGKSSQHTIIKMIPGKRLAITNGGGTPAETHVYDDGTTMYAYLPAKKQYRKMPSQAAKLANTSAMIDGKVSGLNMTYKLLTDTTFAGRKCYAIETIMPGRPSTSKTVMYVEKQTGLPRGVQTTVTQGADKPGGAMTVTMTITMKDILLNAPIPESAFKFTAPLGAVEVKAPQPPAGGSSKPPAPH